jgi:DNA polymerase-3 subunit gamma/tau
MSYQSLYRKYRPQNFEDLVGQDHITSTLKRALAENKLSHAFLFCGPRGTGKTSTARILSKALNCEKGPTPTPCNQCDPCRQITDGSFLDVLEIDAASNRGIDEIRNLKESARYTTTSGKKRVYIIDEVHMLTTEAFNALLKLLEEPPSHLVLILATTEPHKVLSTITSRCQRFEFRSIGNSDIAKRLKFVADSEKVDLAEDAAVEIAAASSGSLRDALSSLEQLIVYCQDKITKSDVIELIGIIDDEKLFEAVDVILSKKAPDAIFFVDSLVKDGFDLKNFTLNLAKWFRNILIAESDKALNTLPGIKEGAAEKFKDRLGKIGSAPAAKLGLLLYKSIPEFVHGDNRLTLEMLLIDCQRLAATPLAITDPIPGNQKAVTQPTANSQINELKNDISRLEKIITDHIKAPAKVIKTDYKADSPSFVAKNGESKYIDDAATIEAEVKEPQTADLTLDEIAKMWPDILKEVRSKKSSTQALLIECRPSTVSGSMLHLVFNQRAEFHKNSLEKQTNIEILKNAVLKVSGKSFSIKCELAGDEKKPENKANNISIKPDIDPGNGSNADELMEFLKQDFDAEVIDKF